MQITLAKMSQKTSVADKLYTSNRNNDEMQQAKET
jgi:hypothetical protein